MTYRKWCWTKNVNFRPCQLLSELVLNIRHWAGAEEKPLTRGVPAQEPQSGEVPAGRHLVLLGVCWPSSSAQMACRSSLRVSFLLPPKALPWFQRGLWLEILPLMCRCPFIFTGTVCRSRSKHRHPVRERERREFLSPFGLCVHTWASRLGGSAGFSASSNVVDATVHIGPGLPLLPVSKPRLGAGWDTLPPINHKGAGALGSSLSCLAIDRQHCWVLSCLQVWRWAPFPAICMESSGDLQLSPFAVCSRPPALQQWWWCPSASEFRPSAPQDALMTYPLLPPPVRSAQAVCHHVLPAPITGSQKLQHTAKDDFTRDHRLSLALSHLMRFFSNNCLWYPPWDHSKPNSLRGLLGNLLEAVFWGA